MSAVVISSNKRFLVSERCLAKMTITICRTSIYAHYQRHRWHLFNANHYLFQVSLQRLSRFQVLIFFKSFIWNHCLNQCSPKPRKPYSANRPLWVYFLSWLFLFYSKSPVGKRVLNATPSVPRPPKAKGNPFCLDLNIDVFGGIPTPFSTGLKQVAKEMQSSQWFEWGLRSHTLFNRMLAQWRIRHGKIVSVSWVKIPDFCDLIPWFTGSPTGHTPSTLSSWVPCWKRITGPYSWSTLSLWLFMWLRASLEGFCCHNVWEHVHSLNPNARCLMDWTYCWWQQENDRSVQGRIYTNAEQAPVTDHKEILHMSWQLLCRDECKISLWSVEYNLNQSTANFGRISKWSKYR